MSKYVNLIGKKFSKLTVIKIVGSFKRRMYWLCECDCGEYTTANTSILNAGKKKSCGCLLSECKKKHGMAHTAEYAVWSNIIERCCNKNNKAFNNYGGRGIKICNRWRGSFDNFFSDMGKRPSNEYSIDRINNNGNYSTRNCKWSTHIEQARNKRNNRIIKIGSITKTLPEWCEIYNITKSTFYNRVNKGFTDQKAITKPVRKMIKNEIEINGKIKNFSQWCSFYNIHNSTVKKRIDRGWTFKEAVATPVMK